MQQVTHRKMSLNYRFKTNHHNSLILQEKIRESEWRRSKLEIEFNELVERRKIDQESDNMGYKRRYRDLLESEKYRIRRNEQLFAALKRLDMRITFLSETTEKYKALRSKYKTFSSRVQRGRGVDFMPKSSENNSQDMFANSLRFTPIEKNLTQPNDRYGTKKPVDRYAQHSDEERSSIVHPISFPTDSKYDLNNQNDAQNNVVENSQLREPEYRTMFERPQRITRGTSYDEPTDALFSEPRNRTNGNEDRFRRDEIEYSDNIRHQIANNSNDLALREPKYKSVDISSDIDEYAIGNYAHKNSALGKQDSGADKLRMPEEVLKKYSGIKGNIEFNPIDSRTYIFEDLKESQSNAPSKFKQTEDLNVDAAKAKSFEDDAIESKIQIPNTIPIKINVENEIDIPDKEHPKIYPVIQENKEVPQITNIQNVTSEIETEISKTQHPSTNTTRNLETGVVPKISEELDVQTLGEETIQHTPKKEIEKSSNEEIEEHADEIDLEAREENRCELIVDHSRTSETESRKEKEKEEDLSELSQVQPKHEIADDDAEVIQETDGVENGTINENILCTNPNESKDDSPYAVTQKTQQQQDKDDEHRVETSEEPIDQRKSSDCQGETSEHNISNDNQNLQQETPKSDTNLEENDNCEDSEMKRFRKRSIQEQSDQYYEQIPVNYPVDENGQPYDMTEQPYGQVLPSATEEQYSQEYQQVYNENGELVYDPNVQPYDQQYYQNDPNYEGYNEYPQQFEGQQQYSEYDQGAYDQEGYNQAEQVVYEESTHQAYDPNTQYQSYYGEEAYDKGPYYQPDTQESVENPQHEENEQPDKTNRLMHMLESDTENSSRQEDKVTTESDFDFSNN